MNASYSEIRQAYRKGLSIYGENSMISYSFFSDSERAQILKKIEEAFLTLADKDRRAGYDKMLVDSGVADPAVLDGREQKEPVPLFDKGNFEDYSVLLRRVKKRAQEKDVVEISNEILSKKLISGRDLKRLRKSMGISLEEVFEVAKIRISVLRVIEGDELEKLPPKVYLKSFLKSYAGLLRVDPKRIVEGYMKNAASDQELGQ